MSSVLPFGVVSDVRAEVKDNALNIFITYGFRGAPLQLPPQS